jgi:hypothetical protein
MTLPPVPATKAGVPHSSPVLGLSGIRSTPVFGLSLGATPDFLLGSTDQRPRMRLSVRKAG